MRQETPEELFVRLVLEGEGYQVERIPEAPPAKRADLHAIREGEQLVVEVKTREPSTIELKPDGMACWKVPLEYQDSLSGIIQHGSKQLASTPTTKATLRLIWFVLSGIDWEANALQLKATLYGSVDIIHEFRMNRARSKPCYGFTFAEFRRQEQLDAAVIGTLDTARVYLNPWGVRRSAFRGTALWKSFCSHGAVTDPEAEDSRGDVFLADFEGDRRDETAMLAGIQHKYGHERLTAFRPTLRQAAILAVATPAPHTQKTLPSVGRAGRGGASGSGVIPECLSMLTRSCRTPQRGRG